MPHLHELYLQQIAYLPLSIALHIPIKQRNLTVLGFGTGAASGFATGAAAASPTTAARDNKIWKSFISSIKMLKIASRS
jgi:hypothetical protein